LTCGYGGWPTWSDAEESAAKKEHIYNTAALEQVWQYLLRRVPG